MAGNSYNFGLALENLNPETLQAPETRIKDAATGRKIFFQMEYDDQQRNLVRARHQAMLDGQPPYDQALRAQKGQGALTNVNFGNAKEIMDFFMSGMIDLDAAVEQLLTPPLLKQVVPDDAIRSNLENILGSEWTRMVRNWEGYAKMRLTISHWFGAHGIGIGYFEDDRDWRPEATGLGEFVIPNGTKASEDSIVVSGCRKYIELHQLYAYIRNEEAAQAMGWNVDAVKKAMLKACPDTVWEGYPVSWQRLETLIRNNDLGFGYGGGGTLGQIARTAKVALIHLWCQEFDQTVTKYTTTVQNWMDGSAEANEPWLFMRPHVFERMSNGMVFFPYGIGDNGTYHAVSGILRAIFPQVNAINRCQSQMLDAAMMGCSMKIQPKTEAAMSRMNVIPLGPIWLMPSEDHGTIVDQRNPDVAQSVMPVIADLRATINTRAGQFQGNSSPLNSNVEKTRFQVAAELEALGKVGATQELLWNPPWTRLLREMMKRSCREDYEENWPGGREVKKFKERLLIRGFPLELLKFIDFDGIQANRAVGAGSGAARIGRLENLRQLAPEYDATGRHNLVRDLTAAQLGGDYDLANRYMPPKVGERPPVDEQIADIENLLIKQKQEPTVVVNQDHWVHIYRHSDEWGKMVGQIESGEVEQTELAEQMMIFQSHVGEHLSQVNDSVIMEQQAAEARQIYQQLSAITENVVRKAVAEQQKAMEEEMEAGAAGEQVDPMLQQKAIEARLKVEAFVAKEQAALAFDQQKHEQDLQQKSEMFRMNAAHSDAKVAADLIVKAKERLDKAEINKKQKEDAIEIAKMKRAAAKKPAPRKKK